MSKKNIVIETTPDEMLALMRVIANQQFRLADLEEQLASEKDKSDRYYHWWRESEEKMEGKAPEKTDANG